MSMLMPLSIKITLATLGTFAILVVGTYFLEFGISYPGDKAELGQLGDYVGGLLNPILTFSSIVILLWSVRTQSEQLASSNEALRQSQVLHEQQLAAQKREHIRSQLRAEAEAYIRHCEALQDKPIFTIALEPEGPQVNISLNDTFKSPAFFGNPIVNSLLESIPEILNTSGPAALHLNILRAQLSFAVGSTCNLIQYLDLLVLRRSWEMRLRSVIMDHQNLRILTEQEANEFVIALHGAMAMAERNT